MSDPDDSTIPVLHEILVPGNPAQARHAPGDAAAPATQPVLDPETAQEPVFAPEARQEPEPVLAPESAHARQEPTLAPEPVHVREEPTLAPEPVHVHEEPTLAPEPVHVREEPTLAPEPVPEPVHPEEPAHPKKRSRAHHAADHRHGHEPDFGPSAGVFDRAEPHAPIEAGTIVPPDIAHEALAQPQPNLDADVIAERLRGRFAGFLTGEGRGIIEARCRDALQDHTSWLVNQITREVALTLETELTGWLREAIDQEIARRSGSA